MMNRAGGHHPAKHQRLYSAPKRFDLSTMLVVTTAYALLFATMKALDFREISFFYFSGLITFIGAAQSLLCSWQKPRTVSILAGLVFHMAMYVWAFRRAGYSLYMIADLFQMLFFGTILSYFCGVLVGGVFLVSEFLRTILLGRAPIVKTRDDETDRESPWHSADD